MSRQKLIDWGKWGALAACVVALPFVTGYTRKALAIADTPDKQTALEARVNSIETNCSENFREIRY